MFRSILVLVMLSSLAFDASAQAPSKISFQGYLTDDLGNPIDGSRSMTLRLYRSGTEIWSEPQTVTFNDGIFNVALGRGVDLDTVAFDDAFQLGVTVAKDPEMPRISLLSAAYARALPGLYTFYRDNGVSDGYNVIGGSEHNIVGTDVVMGTIGGGGRSGQPNAVTKTGATVGGGLDNTGSGTKSTVAGGNDNTASGESSTVGGGERNTASAFGAGVLGGQDNDATGVVSTVVGGGQNDASGQFATVAGGYQNWADGGYSFAAGKQAKALHGGSFVWKDSTGGSFESSGPNQFLIDAHGGVGIGTNAPGSKLTVNGRIESETGGFRFPDGTTQTSAAATVTDYWKLGGNSGTTPGSDFIGTSDGTAVEIRSGGGVDISTTNLDLNGGPEDAIFLINADSDNSGESDNALIQMRQDGGNIGVNIGFAEGGFGSDVFGIGRRNTGTNLYDTFVIQTEDGDVGIGTNNPGNNRLKVINGRSSGTSSATIWAENTGASSAIAGYFKSGGTDATMVITNDGSGDLIRAFSTGGDLEFAVRNNGDVSADGDVGVGVEDPLTGLHVRKTPTTDSGNLTTAYVALFENPQTGASADGIAIKIGTTGNPTGDANFVGFFDGDTGLIGQIEGNGSGGVSYNTTGSDYAEYLPLLDPTERIEAGDIVGLFAGRIARSTVAADQVLVVTDRPAVVGNMPAGEDVAIGFLPVSFIGQVPVKVRGPVAAGDLLVPSGYDDGTAIAVTPTSIDPEQVSVVFATAWESSTSTGITRINAAIGVDQAAAAARVIEALHSRLESQDVEIALIRSRLSALEAASIN